MTDGPPIASEFRAARVYPVLTLVAIYIGVFLCFDRLAFGVAKDERFYWPTIQRFAQDFPPSWSLVRDYDEPSTPFFFICFGAIEHFTHGGIQLARIINLLLSFALACIVLGWWQASRASILACIGLLLFPYYLGTSVYLYPDILAALFAVLGFWAARSNHRWPAAILFALGIATRQYLIAFPAAYLAQTAVESFKTRRWSRLILPYLLSCATFGGWILIFGGLAPRSGYESHLATSPSGWHIDHALYFLSCIGVYYVVIEAALFLGWLPFPRRWALALPSAVILLFLIWPPIGNSTAGAVPSMGYLDKSLRALMPDAARIVALGFLAVLTALRFARSDVLTWMLYTNAAVLLRSHTAWDKYALPLLAVLWFARPPVISRRLELPAAS